MFKRGDIVYYKNDFVEYEVLEYDPRRDNYRIIQFEPASGQAMVLDGWFVRTRMIKVGQVRAWFSIHETC